MILIAPVNAAVHKVVPLHVQARRLQVYNYQRQWPSRRTQHVG